MGTPERITPRSLPGDRDASGTSGSLGVYCLGPHSASSEGSDSPKHSFGAPRGKFDGGGQGA
jgi:hypothetical protein